jgi:hypothetical protein
MPHRIFALLTILCLLSGGCLKAPIHPGSVDKLDSLAYDANLLYDSGIRDAKADLAAGKLSQSTIPVLNKMIAAYDVLNAATKAYHAAGVPGGTPDTLAKLNEAEAAAAAAWVEFVQVFPKAGTKK